MLIDMTIPLHDGMKLSGAFPPVAMEHFFDFDRDQARYLPPCTGCQVERLSLVTHVGTHADAPRHFIRGGESLELFSLDHYMGSAYFVDVSHRPEDQPVDAAFLRSCLTQNNILEGTDKILLLRLSQRHWSDPEFHSVRALTQDAAQLVVQYGFKCIGIDSMCVDCMEDMRRIAHMELLGAGVAIVEGLANMDKLSSRDCWFCALPLKLSEAGGSPVRAICEVQ